MGICPQENVLYGNLTVGEHVEMFCSLRGIPPDFQLIKEIDLLEYRSTLAKNLSGGNKRKLQVALALLQPVSDKLTLVLLDEPTAGLDLSARRKLWNVLEKNKKNKILVLTTHYMDEADVLGDRIGIMAKG
jgi:ATP-binding cassette subfamily A (ABC1) protein 3